MPNQRKRTRRRKRVRRREREREKEAERERNTANSEKRSFFPTDCHSVMIFVGLPLLQNSRRSFHRDDSGSCIRTGLQAFHTVSGKKLGRKSQFHPLS